MFLRLGQIIYTSFPGVGFKVLASARVPTEIQKAFIQQVVYQHWDSLNPPKSGYRAAYIHQLAPEQILFGWLYNDGIDDLGRSHVPYFQCYYLTELLYSVLLENIFTCLHKGPIILIERQNLPDALDTIITSDLRNYQPARIGVAIPSGIRDRSLFALKQKKQKKLVKLFLEKDEQEIVRNLNPQKYNQQAISTNNFYLPQTIKTGLAALKTVVVEAKTTTPSQKAKIALLIGVSKHGSGFNSLPRAQKDVEAMQQILQYPEIGSFAEIKTLIDPDRQMMEEAIESLFLKRQSDELVLLYFSGYGIKDQNGKLYLATSITCKNTQEKLVKSSAVLISFISEIMSNSRFKNQVVILECSFINLAEPYSNKDTSVDIKNQLAKQGRVILTSSTSTQYSCEQNKLESLYTHYFVEGMKTGAADLNNDGVISIKELHEYTSRKVKKAVPVMQPGIYGVEDDNQIVVAKAFINHAQRKYRQEAEHCAEHGEISIVSRSILDVLRNKLGLLPEEAAAIEAEVLDPYCEYQQRLQRYVQEFVDAIHPESFISHDTRKRCKHLQQSLGLRDEDVAPIEAQIALQIKVFQSPDRVKGAREIQIIRSLINDSQAATKTEIAPTRTITTEFSFTEENSNINSSNSAYRNFVPTDRNFSLLVGVSTVIGIAAAMGVLSPYLQLNELRTLKIDAKYEKCITKAEVKSQIAETVFHQDVQGLLNECRLEHAKMLAASEKFSMAIAAAAKIPKNSHLYPEAQKLIKEWLEI